MSLKFWELLNTPLFSGRCPTIMEVREGFSYTEEIDEEDGALNLTIQLKGHPLQAAMTI